MSGVAKRLNWKKKEKPKPSKVVVEKKQKQKTVRERVDEQVQRLKPSVSKKVLLRRDKNKEKFLKLLEEMPIIQVASSRLNIHRSTYYRWYEEDPTFRDLADKALGQGVYFINDMMESLLIKLAKEGKISAIALWLKNHHQQYMEPRKYEHFHKHQIEENPLTQERLSQIEKAMYAWDSVDDSDYNESDYEINEEETS